MMTVGSRRILTVSASYLSPNIVVLNKYCLLYVLYVCGLTGESSYLEWPWLGGCEDLGLACSCVCGSGGTTCYVLDSPAHCISHPPPGARGLAGAHTFNGSVRGTREQAEIRKGSCMRLPRFGQA